MRRTIALLTTLALLLVPAAAVGHDSSGTDTNTLVFDNVWPVFGPGGTTEVLNPVLDDLGLHAVRFGGADAGASASTTHHDEATYPLTGYQCDGDTVQMSSETPYFHSDLENGIFEATGSFYVDIDITGADADDVDALWFGFAHTLPWPASSVLCTGELPLPGAYYEFYRGDTNGADGWEIPVNTLLVPDMAYGAVLRALDAQGNVLGTAFVYANVNNYMDDTNWQPGTPTACDQDGTGQLLCPYHDVTPPFPTVKGALGHAQSGICQGVSFEYGEPLSSFNVDATYSEFTDDERDVDPFPIVTVTTDNWGPGYCVTGVSPGNSITATAVDQSGNVGVRTVTV